jgi:hypothetical protein
MTLDDFMADRLDVYRHAAITDLWLRSAGLPETEVDRWAKPVKYEDLAKTEWSPEFEELMRNRLVMGALRYGRLKAPCKKNWDRIPSIKRRLDEYVKTGNLEMLVDCANLCLLTYCEDKHPTRHWPSADEEESATEHVKEKP